MSLDKQTVHRVLDTIPLRYRGPGGAAAVIKDGEVVGQRVWGYADQSQRIPVEASTQFPICSITKQFVCGLLMDLYRNPTPAMAARGDVQKQFTEKLHELLPMTRENGLTIENLCDMQSGIRDYWAMTTLWGAKPEDEFLIARDSPPMLDRTKSLHFQPGMEYSYSNVNFYLVGRIIEHVTGEPLGKLLEERILKPAGMATALLCPNTAHHPPPCVGYEGNEDHGFCAAVNRMEWSGDAGLVASLDDMIAYEKYLDRLFSDPQSWYYTATKPHTFSDGTPARYHYGLAHVDINGIDSIGHGGALRGYRLHRRHVPQEHLSVVVLFNHEADASEAVNDILRGVLSRPNPEMAPVDSAAEWIGVFLDEATQLAITVVKGSQVGEVLITYAEHLEAAPLKLTDAKNGRTSSMIASIDGDILRIHRLAENRKLEAQRLTPQDTSLRDPALPGDYYCAEVDSTFHCTGSAGMLYGSFDGYLGQGIVTPMRYLGNDVWALTCPRGLDASAPGDWTVVFHRDENSSIVGFKIGCWLARGLDFVKKQ
ncbi:D-aminopeptidase [Penicillium canariense]|uniref:D-aminopeptidase n=1 Tax=Penicillium canariense TaxID=189055 RepID=A0A9W9LII0_9EURO|nr:D-aminopeptidase [Penicillium canariense]KAJ5159797.1 D-aminopeptidase [Penicillium canariense]